MQANKKYTYVSEKALIYMYEKNQWIFYGIARVSTLAPESILLTEAHLQKFLFL